MKDLLSGADTLDEAASAIGQLLTEKIRESFKNGIEVGKRKAAGGQKGKGRISGFGRNNREAKMAGSNPCHCLHLFFYFGVLRGVARICQNPARSGFAHRAALSGSSHPPLGNCFFDISARQLYLKTSRYCHIAVKPQKRRSKDGEEGQTFARLTG